MFELLVADIQSTHFLLFCDAFGVIVDQFAWKLQVSPTTPVLGSLLTVNLT